MVTKLVILSKFPPKNFTLKQSPECGCGFFRMRMRNADAGADAVRMRMKIPTAQKIILQFSKFPLTATQN